MIEIEVEDPDLRRGRGGSRRTVARRQNRGWIVCRRLRPGTDEVHRRDVLRRSVLEQLEVLAREVGDEAAVLVEDANVHFDQLHARREGRRRLLCLLTGAERGEYEENSD